MLRGRFASRAVLPLLEVWEQDIGGVGAIGCIYLDVVLGVEGRVADRRHRVRGHPVQRYRVHLISHEKGIKSKPFRQRSLLHSMFFTSHIKEFM